MDDSRSAEARPIDGWQKRVRVRTTLLNPPFKTLVDRDMHRSRTIGTAGGDFHQQAFVSEAPLHEGRGEVILRSCAEDMLSDAEPEAVRSQVGGHGQSPAYSPRYIYKALAADRGLGADNACGWDRSQRSFSLAA
jgi:hypothetical protein